MDKDLHPLIEVADVEELAELQELEDETNKAPSASPLLSFGCVRGLLKSYEGIPSPMALLDA
ncbi:MAG TPA: hypothetical protein PK625_03810, partial [Spirochaetales bacterium]|nr:hypothetical protein [Spirochaetales bacterium]